MYRQFLSVDNTIVGFFIESHRVRDSCVLNDAQNEVCPSVIGRIHFEYNEIYTFALSIDSNALMWHHKFSWRKLVEIPMVWMITCCVSSHRFIDELFPVVEINHEPKIVRFCLFVTRRTHILLFTVIKKA